MDKPKTIALSYPQDGIARLELIDPSTRNALGSQMLAELDEATRQVAESGARVVVVTGQGDHFSVGGDLGNFARHLDGDLAALVRLEAEYICNAFNRLHEMDSVVVVGARGSVAGGAVGFVIGADMAVLAEDVRINLAYSRIGASPDAGTSWHLPKQVGYQRAFELLAFSETIDAKEAIELGLATRLVSVAELETTMMSLAGRLAAIPAVTLSNIKCLLRKSTYTGFQEHLKLELEAFEAAVGQNEFRERIAAWTAHRKPR